MNDARQEEAKQHATTDLPLQAQLMGQLALVFILSAVAGVVGYATFDGTSLENSVRAKSTMYASNLTAQLYGAVGTGDAGLAEEVIEPLRTDRNVYGVAVYAPGGRRLAGHGKFPATLVSGDQVKLADDRVLLTLREINVGEGAGRSPVSRAVDRTHRLGALPRRAVPGDDHGGGAAVRDPARARAFLQRHDVRVRAHVRGAPPDGAHGEAAPREARVRAHARARARPRAVPARGRRHAGHPVRARRRGRPFRIHRAAGSGSAWGSARSCGSRSASSTCSCRASATARCARSIDDSKSGNFELETTVLTEDEKRIDLRWVVSCEQSESTGQHKVLRGMMLDVTDQRRLENELAQAQKLETVGRLAAGVAHEINTPVQFVSDSVQLRARSDGRPVRDRRQVPRAAHRHPEAEQPARTSRPPRRPPRKPKTTPISTTSSRTRRWRSIARATASAASRRSCAR